MAETIESIVDGQSSVLTGVIDVAPSDASLVRAETGKAYLARLPATIDAGKMWWALDRGRPW
jgi:hypothetical protein